LKNKVATILAALLSGILVITGLVAANPAQATGPTNVSYIALPHPDDEWQTWALTENSPANYKVFILMTRGEQTGYCTPKWTEECADRRVDSLLGYLTDMSAKDPALPGDFENLGERGPFPANGVNLTRVDDTSYAAKRTAEVFRDRQGRGAVVVFDLGDGDLTEAEAVWAVKTTRDNRGALGLNTTLPNWNLLGTYYNKNYAGCFQYPHPDHYSVHRALYHTNFGFGYQAAATCGSDPEAVRKQAVKTPSVDAAWGPGAFRANYGWLGSYQFSQTQVNLFHGTQTYWVRHKN
jgi:hypothetical protein